LAQTSDIPKQIATPANNEIRHLPTGKTAAFEHSIVRYLASSSDYCTREYPDKNNKWLQEFLCGVKITDVIIAVFSILLFFATAGLIVVGWMQARRMRVTARQQLRAYVFVDNITIGNVTTPLAWEVGSSYKPTGAEIVNTSLGPVVSMTIKNTGQTPAHNVINWGEIALREFPLRGDLATKQRTSSHFVTKSSIPANGISTKAFIMGTPLLADEVGDLKRGTKAIYVYGYILYRDAFGRRRKTNYRFIHGLFTGSIGIATAMTIADEGNTAN